MVSSAENSFDAGFLQIFEPNELNRKRSSTANSPPTTNTESSKDDRDACQKTANGSSKERPKQFYCRMCTSRRSVYYTEDNYEKHWRANHPDVDPSEMYKNKNNNFQCPECLLRFQFQHGLSVHLSRVHLTKVDKQRKDEVTNYVHSPIVRTSAKNTSPTKVFKYIFVPKDIKQKDIVDDGTMKYANASENNLSISNSASTNVRSTKLPTISSVNSLSMKQESNEDAFSRLSPGRLTCHIESLPD